MSEYFKCSFVGLDGIAPGSYVLGVFAVARECGECAHAVPGCHVTDLGVHGVDGVVAIQIDNCCCVFVGERGEEIIVHHSCYHNEAGCCQYEIFFSQCCVHFQYFKNGAKVIKS